jgi:hypothetical protein
VAGDFSLRHQRGMGLLFGLFVKQSEETNPQFPLAVGQEERLPAGARLQQFPANEFVDFRQHEESILKNYGWVNKETGWCDADHRRHAARGGSAACPRAHPPPRSGGKRRGHAGNAARNDAGGFERRPDLGKKKAIRE